MKKIGLYIQAGPSCGGTYQYNRIMLDALSDLDRSKYAISVFYGADHWQEILNQKNIEAQKVSTLKFWHILASLWRRLHLPMSWWRTVAKHFHPLAQKMIKEKCDLWIFPSQDAFAYLMPVDAIAVVHDLMHRYEGRFPEVGAAKEFNIREFHYQNTCRFARGIFVDSELGKKQLMESYAVNQQQCMVLPYIAPKDLHEISSPTFAHKFDLPEQFLFYPAQFWQHKNHENLLKALKRCTDESLDMHLVLVGSPKNHYEKVMGLISELKLEKQVHCLGLVEDEDIPEFYRRAKALVMPTFFGPTNIPPLEAFALGCPVAISGIYGMKEQLGDAALFFDPNSVNEIADALKRLWTDSALCQTLIQRGKAKNEAWNYRQFAQKLESMMDSFFQGRT